jgi:hypothetical protein
MSKWGAVFLLLASTGFMAADLAFELSVSAPRTHDFVQVIGWQFMIAGFSLMLLAQAFPVVKRQA